MADTAPMNREIECYCPDCGTLHVIAPTIPRETRAPYEQRREAMARLIAASMMGLVKDPTGRRLPDECWQQMLEKADAVLFIVSDHDRTAAGRRMETATYHGPG